jgi:hypothetical protein
LTAIFERIHQPKAAVPEVVGTRSTELQIQARHHLQYRRCDIAKHASYGRIDVTVSQYQASAAPQIFEHAHGDRVAIADQIIHSARSS